MPQGKENAAQDAVLFLEAFGLRQNVKKQNHFRVSKTQEYAEGFYTGCEQALGSSVKAGDTAAEKQQVDYLRLVLEPVSSEWGSDNRSMAGWVLECKAMASSVGTT